jgi:hypothetical protein
LWKRQLRQWDEVAERTAIAYSDVPLHHRRDRNEYENFT